MTKNKESEVLPLEGEIDLHVSPRIALSLRAITDGRPKRVVIDMSKVSYIDSSGLAVLIESMQTVQRYGGKFALAALQEGVRPIMEVARLDQVFPIYPDVKTALAA